MDTTEHHPIARFDAERALVKIEAIMEGVRSDLPEHAEYPYQDGDSTVLGPEIFAFQRDGEWTVCWMGVNYVAA